MKEIQEQEAQLVDVKASRVLAHLSESNEAAQKISEEKRAVQARIDQLPPESPEDIDILV